MIGRAVADGDDMGWSPWATAGTVACGSGTVGSHRGANPRENRGPAQSYFLGSQPASLHIVSRFTILGSFADGARMRAIAPEYRDLLRATTDPQVSYCVVQFRHAREAVVDSATVRRALAQIVTPDAVLAIGGHFTAEALAVLRAANTRAVRLGEFHWTDHSWHSRRS